MTEELKEEVREARDTKVKELKLKFPDIAPCLAIGFGLDIETKECQDCRETYPEYHVACVEFSKELAVENTKRKGEEKMATKKTVSDKAKKAAVSDETKKELKEKTAAKKEPKKKVAPTVPPGEDPHERKKLIGKTFTHKRKNVEVKVTGLMKNSPDKKGVTIEYADGSKGIASINSLVKAISKDVTPKEPKKPVAKKTTKKTTKKTAKKAAK
jgi:hypothetical protein